MKYTVTGGLGFIGGALSETLAKQDHDVSVIDNKHSPNSTILDSGVVRNAIKDSDAVFHIGGASGSLHFNDVIKGCETNCIGTLNVLEACRKFDKKLVFASTSSSYAWTPLPHKEPAILNVPNFYTATKIFNEHSIRLYQELYGIEAVIFRFGSVYGRDWDKKGDLANVIGQFMYKMILKEKPVIWGNGKQTRDFIYVKDAIKGIMKGLALPNGIYNLATGKETSFIEVVKILNKVMGTNIKPVFLKKPDTGVQKRYVDRQKLDISKIKKHGWKPEYTVEQGVRDIWKNL